MLIYVNTLFSLHIVLRAAAFFAACAPRDTEEYAIVPQGANGAPKACVRVCGPPQLGAENHGRPVLLVI